MTALAATKLGVYLDGPTRVQPLLAGGLVSALVVTNSLFFLFSPASLFGSNRLPLQTPSRQTIVQRDDFLRERINYIKTHFKPESTVILADGSDFRHPSYYLREYQLSQLSFTLPEEGQQLPEAIKTVVLFTPGAEQNLQITGAQLAPHSNGDLLPYFVRTDEYPIYVARAVDAEMN
ncbi:MAG: hypothetical protein HYR94_08870 [Chloroflexi bacterium]|nr:hypothetical protein [Chloroflexota bacterium]